MNHLIFYLIAVFFLSGGLLALAIIDWQHQILPDQITLPCLWIGLFINLTGLFCSLQSAIIGAGVGYLSLWIFTWIFYQWTGKVGMGHGDFKMFAMLGAWLGWQLLPFIILTATILGTLTSIFLIIIRKQNIQQPIPFGPYLALAGWIGLLWGHTINQIVF